MILSIASGTPGEEHGVKVPPGFKVPLYANLDLANDNYYMTLVERGRVVDLSRG